MASDLKSEKLLPSLFCRIDEGLSIGLGVGVGIRAYRNDILRNLEWILNSERPSDSDPEFDRPHCRESVLNFGIPELAGRSRDGFDVKGFCRDVKSAILTFEPRILAKDFDVTIDENEEQSIRLSISGEFWCEPYPETFSVGGSFDQGMKKWMISED